MDADAWTPEFLIRAGYDLTVYCEGPCRAGRPVSLTALAAAGRGAQPISRMRFRCPKCGAKGTASVSWWDHSRQYKVFEATSRSGS